MLFGKKENIHLMQKKAITRTREFKNNMRTVENKSKMAGVLGTMSLILNVNGLHKSHKRKLLSPQI